MVYNIDTINERMFGVPNTKEYRQRKLEGLCPNCGKILTEKDGDFIQCAQCREKDRRRKQERKTPKKELTITQKEKQHESRKLLYWSRKERHLCVLCGKQDAYTLSGKIRCYDCSQKWNKRNREYTRNYSQSHKDKIKEYRDTLKKNGICVVCEKNPAVKGKTRCSVCATRQNFRQAQRNAERNPTLPDGCLRCHHNPRKPGFKVCERCYEQMIRTQAIGQEKIRETMSRENHPWKKDNALIFGG